MKVRLNTNHGDIVLALNEEKAPLTVENFVTYVKSGHYNGTIFHRVINDFMIQTGGMDADMNEKSTNACIKNEANNGLSNLQGTVAMARRPDPHSASAQFFINTNDNAFLNFSAETDDGWGYCVFGEVVEGIETVEKIEETSTTSKGGHQDVPEEAIVITHAEIIEE
ncbi:MAG: peptidyl-prolyl cis-trans isomerase B (cyclophilin B) [Gammaproteobacteria bacterium]|jgi:peptidyl-prolyl cis-trans isomerase B (cyclophilin B)